MIRQKLLIDKIPFQKCVKLLSISFLAINLCFLFCYISFAYQKFFHSDSATKVLLAREIISMHDYFPNDWNYVNGDLFVVFGHIFIIPLLLFLPAGYTVHAIAGGVSALLILFTSWLLIRILTENKSQQIFVLAVLAGGISGLMAENLYGQVSYGAGVYQIFLICYLVWIILQSDEKKERIFSVYLIVFLVLFTWSNPQRSFINLIIPILLSVVFCWIKNYKMLGSNFEKSVLRILLLTLFSLFIGYSIHKFTLAGVNDVKGVASARWLSFDLVIRNLALTFQGFLALLGSNSLSNRNIYTFEGIYEAIRLLAAFIFLSISPIAFIRLLHRSSLKYQYFGMFSLASLVPLLFIYLTTTVPEMINPIQSSRYFVPAFVLIIILVLTQPLYFSRPIYSSCIILVFIVFTASGYITLIRTNIYSQVEWDQKSSYNSVRFELIEILRTEGLSYGYATYWNSAVLSVLSNEKVLVRQIVIQNGIPAPFRHLNSNRWYSCTGWSGKTFLLLENNEINKIDWDLLEKIGCRPIKKIEWRNYNILVFDNNIAQFFPDWDLNASQCLASPVQPSQPISIGMLNPSLKFIGWSYPESAHRWSEGKKCSVTFLLKLPFTGLGELYLTGNTLGSQQIIISINSKVLYSEKSTGSDQVIKITGISNLLKDGENLIEIQTPDARKPESADPRLLGFSLKKFELR
jgi:hypothetical protein